jgi:DNA helicase-2/ATP-dependent DNA helicase PcrA
LKILREDINYLNRNNNFTIIDEEDQLAIMKDIYRVNNINQELIKPKKMINSIAAIKMTQVDLALITSFSQLKKLNIYNFDELKQVKYVNKLYQTKLLESNCLDFEDLLILTKKLLSDFPHICNK